jgi:hypothetical protein
MADNTAKANGRTSKAGSQKARSSRTTKAEVAEEMVDGGEQVVQPDSEITEDGETMSSDNVVQITAHPAQAENRAEQSAIELHQPSLTIWNRPVMPSEIEVAETMSVAGIRPIAVSHLELAGSFLNGRPIAASRVKVLGILPGDRPILDSGFKSVEGAILPGNRPIMASEPELLQASTLPGNRPIASNAMIDPEPEILMGYLD